MFPKRIDMQFKRNPCLAELSGKKERIFYRNTLIRRRMPQKGRRHICTDMLFQREKLSVPVSGEIPEAVFINISLVGRDHGVAQDQAVGACKSKRLPVNAQCCGQMSACRKAADQHRCLRMGFFQCFHPL